MKKIVVLGGGTGLSTILRGLKDYPVDLTAVVTMTDDGASSGRLRKDMDMLPPGDIRKCIAALSNNESLLIELFEHRFKKGLGLRGHKFGNLWITALQEMSGSFEVAVEETSRLLAVRGQVLPSTLEKINLKAEFEDGKTIVGETKIVKYGYNHKIKKIALTKPAKANKKAVEAISKADVILVGPGSLFTSILPNFLLKEIKTSFAKSKAAKIYICNASTERGETVNFGLHEHCRELKSYGVIFDNSIINRQYFPEGSGDGYVNPVIVNCSNCGGCEKFEGNLVNKENPLYHDPDKLAAFTWRTINNRKLKRA